jgi:excisionase family DNA binding protein
MNEVPMTTERKTTTIDEAAQVLGISRNFAYAAAKRGEIPTVKIGRLLLGFSRSIAGATKTALLAAHRVDFSAAKRFAWLLSALYLSELTGNHRGAPRVRRACFLIAAPSICDRGLTDG